MENDNEDDLNLPPEGGDEQPENRLNQDEYGFDLDKLNTVADFLNARHPDIDAFMKNIFAPHDDEEEEADESGEFEIEDGQKIKWEIRELSQEEWEAMQAEEESEEEEEEWEEYEQESEPLSKEEEYELLMQDLQLLEQHLDEEEADSAALKKFKRLVREKLDELKKLDEKVESAQEALDNALQNLSEKMQELMEKIQMILASAPKIIRVFELGIPQDDLNNFRQKLLALQGQNQPETGENPYLYFQPLPVDADEDTIREKLTLISMRGDVEAFRFLQQIEKEITQPLRGWARAALLQAQMQMENSLSDEPIALVSTGLGGVDNLVRHLCFVPSVEPLTEGKALFIRQEFETQAEADKGRIESFELQANYVRMQILLPYLQDSRQFALNALENCGFLIGDFWMTSLAEPTAAEVEQWITDFLNKNTINLSDLLDVDSK